MAKQKTKTRVKREVKKQIKKRPLLFALLAFFLVLGAAGGYFGGKYITRNDCFEVVGQQTIFLNVGQTYQEQGAKAVSFGKNITSKIKAEDNVNTSKAGEYYVKYTVDDIRYKDVVRYRYVVVTEVADEA